METQSDELQLDETHSDFEKLAHRLENSDGRVDELMKEAAKAIRALCHANQVLWNSVHNSEIV